MTYLISWHTRNHIESIERFKTLKSFRDQDIVPGVKISQSWHVLGDARGFMVARTNDAAKLQALLISWADAIECNVQPIITDAEALVAFANEPNHKPVWPKA